MQEFKVELVTAEIDMNNGAIVGLGDIHTGNQTDGDILMERKAINHILKHPEYRVILNGDIIDNIQFSNHPTTTHKNLEQEIEELSNELRPIFSQIAAVSWGNHEERAFREPVGKGVMMNPLWGHYSLAQEIKEKNPELIYAELMRGIHLGVHTQKNEYQILIKHGSRAGASHFSEFEDCLRLYNDVDYIIMNHTHRPFISPTAKIDPDGKVYPVWFVRGGSFTSWLPYQEKRNLPPSLPAFVKIPIDEGVVKNPIIQMV